MNIRRSVLSLLLAAALLAALLTGCGAKSEVEQREDFAGGKIGIVIGTVHEDIVRQHYPKAELYSYYYNTDLVEALDKGKIDAYVIDEPVARLLVQSHPN